MEDPSGRDRGRHEWVAWAIVMSAAAVLARAYFFDIDMPNYVARLELHRAIIEGTGPSPYQYRVLVPFSVEAVVRGLARFLPQRVAFVAGFAAYDFAALFLLLGALYRYLRHWFSSSLSLVGTLFVAVAMPLALRDHYYQPWSLIEPALISLALAAIMKERRWHVLALTAVASLNRETGVLIPALYLVGATAPREDRRERGGTDRPVLFFALCCAVWAAVFFGVRALVGEAPQLRSAGEILGRNLDDQLMVTALWNVVLFLGFFWVAALRGFRAAPLFLRRVALVVPGYLVLIAVWGVWREVRLLMPLYPLVVPLALWYLRPRLGRREGNV